MTRTPGAIQVVLIANLTLPRSIRLALLATGDIRTKSNEESAFSPRIQRNDIVSSAYDTFGTSANAHLRFPHGMLLTSVFLVIALDEVVAWPSPLDYLYPRCDKCLELAGKFTKLVYSRPAFDEVRPHLISLCETALDQGGWRGDVICPGLVDAYGPPSIFVLTELYLSPLEICRNLEFCPRERNSSKEPRQCTAKRRTPDPEPKSSSNRTTDLIRILHLTDIHLDHEYAVGTATDCGYFICCRAGLPGKGEAGAFGDYSCDLSTFALNHLVNHLQSLDPQPDFIVYTGDNSPHDVWKQNSEMLVNATDFLVDYLSARFPNLMIYPALGNHESFPANFYYPPFDRNLTTILSRLWKKWIVRLPDDAAETIELGGYYTLLLREGLRLMAINTDFGYQLNVYTLLNNESSVFRRQREWMNETLYAAEQKGEKVLILGHIPPGIFTTIESYGEFYVPLIQRYRSVIVGQLFGHTHRDHFEVVGNECDLSGVVFISPPVTTFLNVNPSYRIYLMDPSSFEIIDYEQYHINLTEANRLAKMNRAQDAKWVKLYEAQQEYGLRDMSPRSWWDLSER